MTTALAFVLILVLLAVAALAALRAAERYRVTVFPWTGALFYRDGRFERVLEPGRYWSGAFGLEVKSFYTGRQILTVPAQEVLTADGFPVKLGVIVEYRIADLRRAQEATGGSWVPLLHSAVQLALRAPVQVRNLDALLADLDALEAEIAPAVLATAEPVGIAVERVALRDLILPAEVRRLVTEVERARREGLAALERARGEQAALRSLANAARLLKGNPELHALRVLQALASQPGRPAPTLVLGGGALLPVGTASSEPAVAPQEAQPEA